MAKPFSSVFILIHKRYIVSDSITMVLINSEYIVTIV